MDKEQKRQRLRQIRKEIGVNQTKFSEMLGVSVRSVKYYEKGEVEVPAPVDKLIDYMVKEREAANA